MEAEQTKLEIAEQFVRKDYEGEYEGARYELVIVLEGGTKLIRQLYKEEE